MDKIFNAIGTGLGYLDQGVQLYGNIFGGGGGSSITPPYVTPPYTPPSSSGSAGSAGSETNTIGGINVSTLLIIGLAVLLLKR